MINPDSDNAGRLFLAAAAACAAVTIFIFIFMLMLGFPVFRDGRLLTLLVSAWEPGNNRFGIAPMIVGTLSIAILSLLAAIPLSLGCAALISGLAPKALARRLHRVVHLMTGIPTVIYGFVGLFLLVPIIRRLFEHGSGLCILSAAIMLALLVSPTMTLLFTNSLLQVPKKYLEAATALGAGPAQRLVHVMLPQARAGLLAGVVLAMGRAMGDTMIALMLAGNAVAFPQGLLDPARTLTGHVALVIAADYDSMAFRTLFVCGLTLYALTTVMVLSARRIAGSMGGPT